MQYAINPFEGERVVLLHGWGGDMRSFYGVYDYLTRSGVPAINLAFPKEVPEFWGICDYAAYIKGFLKSVGAENPALIGHSFGGRVALILASEGFASKLMLVDAAGLKPRGVKRAFKMFKIRVKKALGGDISKYASPDYKALMPAMRPVFKRIVNTHLDGLCEKVTVPTHIVWGRRDKDTPPYMARKFKRTVKNSKLFFLDGGHYSYIDDPVTFKSILTSFVLL